MADGVARTWVRIACAFGLLGLLNGCTASRLNGRWPNMPMDDEAYAAQARPQTDPFRQPEPAIWNPARYFAQVRSNLAKPDVRVVDPLSPRPEHEVLAPVVRRRPTPPPAENRYAREDRDPVQRTSAAIEADRQERMPTLPTAITIHVDPSWRRAIAARDRRSTQLRSGEVPGLIREGPPRVVARSDIPPSTRTAPETRPAENPQPDREHRAESLDVPPDPFAGVDEPNSTREQSAELESAPPAVPPREPGPEITPNLNETARTSIEERLDRLERLLLAMSEPRVEVVPRDDTVARASEQPPSQFVIEEPLDVLTMRAESTAPGVKAMARSTEPQSVATSATNPLANPTDEKLPSARSETVGVHPAQEEPAEMSVEPSPVERGDEASQTGAAHSGLASARERVDRSVVETAPLVEVAAPVVDRTDLAAPEPQESIELPDRLVNPEQASSHEPPTWIARPYDPLEDREDHAPAADEDGAIGGLLVPVDDPTAPGIDRQLGEPNSPTRDASDQDAIGDSLIPVEDSSAPGMGRPKQVQEDQAVDATDENAIGGILIPVGDPATRGIELPSDVILDQKTEPVDPSTDGAEQQEKQTSALPPPAQVEEPKPSRPTPEAARWNVSTSQETSDATLGNETAAQADQAPTTVKSARDDRTESGRGAGQRANAALDTERTRVDAVASAESPNANKPERPSPTAEAPKGGHSNDVKKPLANLRFTEPDAKLEVLSFSGGGSRFFAPPFRTNERDGESDDSGASYADRPAQALVKASRAGVDAKLPPVRFPQTYYDEPAATTAVKPAQAQPQTDGKRPWWKTGIVERWKEKRPRLPAFPRASTPSDAAAQPGRLAQRGQ